MEAATAMDFNTLSRRDLQALCKRNGIRANMTNFAMAEALQGLDTIHGIDEIGTTLCLPTPGRSAIKSAAKMVAVEEQQHGSPLPRGRRVSVKSPEAVRMDVEGGADETKEIVKTPGVALRSTRRGTRATPAPLPTPAPACSTRATARRTAARKAGDVAPTPVTRRSQRTASRKAAGAVEEDRPAEDVSGEKTSNLAMALDQEAEAVAAGSKEEAVQQDEPKAAISDVQCDEPKEDEKVQLDEPKAVASDAKCDEPDVVEVVKFQEGDNKEDELEEDDEGYVVVSVKSCTPPKAEEVVVALEEQPTEANEGIVKEQEPISAEKSGPLTVMEDSPILGVIEKEQDASVEDCEDLAELSLAKEMIDEIVPVTEDKEVTINEEEVASVEDCEDLADDVETDPTPKEILTATGEDETIEEEEVMLIEGKEGAAGKINEEDCLAELKEGAAVEILQGELTYDETSEEDGLDDNETSEDADLTDVRERAAAKMLQGELTDDETSEEDGLDDNETSEDEDDDLTDVSEGAAAKILQGKLTDEETSEEDGLDDNETSDNETSENEDDDLTDGREGAAGKILQGELTDDEISEEDGLDGDEEWTSDDDEYTEGSDEDTAEKSRSADAAQMVQGTGIAEEASHEDDDFSGDLPPEFDNIMVFSDAETESDVAHPVFEENQAAVASATKTVKSLDDSAIDAEQEGPEETGTEKAMKEVDNIVKSLDEFTFEGESKEMKKEQQPQDYKSMSLRKLKSTYKNRLIASNEGKEAEVTEGKRLPLEEVDENARIDH